MTHPKTTEYTGTIELTETEVQHLKAYFDDPDLQKHPDYEQIAGDAFHYDNNSWHGTFPDTAADILCQVLNIIRRHERKP